MISEPDSEPGTKCLSEAGTIYNFAGFASSPVSSVSLLLVECMFVYRIQDRGSHRARTARASRLAVHALSGRRWAECGRCWSITYPHFPHYPGQGGPGSVTGQRSVRRSPRDAGVSRCLVTGWGNSARVRPWLLRVARERWLCPPYSGYPLPPPADARVATLTKIALQGGVLLPQ